MVDLVTSEYKWTDSEVLDLTIRRLRQIKEVIDERRSIEDLQRRVYLEWQTKTLAQFFVAACQDQKAADAVLEAAAGISLTGGGPSGRGKSSAPTLDHLPPDDDPVRAARNAEINRRREAGESSSGGPSFERMAGMFGAGGLMRGGPK